jgi:hypothetical protein
VRALTIWLAMACLMTGVRSSAASTVLFRTDAELIALSERVVHGRVVAQRTVREQPPSRRIYTVTTLAVLEDLTGREGDTIEVWELGGIVGNEIMVVGGSVQYRIGEEVLVCLERGRVGLRSVAMSFSKFEVVRTAGVESALRRDVQDSAIVGGVLPARERTLQEFRELAARVLGRPSRRAAVAPGPVTITQPWTTLPGTIPGWRWPEADSGTPLRVYRNTSAPAPILTGDGVPEIQTALAAWTNPASASIILNYAGTANEFSTDGGWATIPSRSILITFEDPFDDIAGGALAIGGGAATIGTGGTVNGVTWAGFDYGFVVFENAASLDDTYRQPLNFTRIVTHEIGHTIGFNHTQRDGSVANPTSNIMYFSCCFPETPTPPALGPDDLIGLTVVYPAGSPTGPSMALSKTSLRFGVVSSGGGFLYQTSAQSVRLTQSGAGTVNWTATPTRPWLGISQTSGTGAADLTIAVNPAAVLPPSGVEDAAIVFTFSGAANAPGPITVRLAINVIGMSTVPIGAVDTPANNATGVTGAVPFTGWSLDDIETRRVNICRAAVSGENVPANELCANNPQVYVGSAVFIDGARPDVQAAFPSYPLNSRGGWGFMVLTNMLPGQGNGAYHFSIYAQDREAAFALLGTRTLTCDNANATRPFGTIDTPDQGGIASGANYINFGWALTPPGPTMPGKIIPIDGSTITVLIDGTPRGTVNYNHERADIEALFPGYRNTDGTNGPVGFRAINTTTLANGLHTISWTVTDNAGLTQGIGSRFFTVSNASGALTPTMSAESNARASAAHAEAIRVAAADTAPLRARRGWDPSTPWRAYPASGAGRVVIRGEEVDRFELALDRLQGARLSGHLRVGGELAALPAGSQLDAERGVFTWAPAAGFVGAYDLLFVEWSGETAISRREVRIVLAPKTSGLVGSQVVIDTPKWQQDVAQPFFVAGWAADLSAARGTGISGLHAWAYPLNGGPPVFVGTATYGGARPDVAAVHGDDLRESGFGLIVSGLVHGNYDLAIFPWSSESGGFLPASVVRITVR